MDWITMSLEARNLAYNNVEHVGPDNARKKTEGWAAASKTLREQRSQHLDLAYGTGERNKWDLYPANDPKAPCFVHIHGGYWQRGSKEIFACLSEGPLARGWSAALCGYTLAPEASLTQIEAARRIREPSLDLAARKLLAHNDRAIPVETDEMERVFADIDADCCNGFKATGVVWHGMLLIL